MQLQLVCVPIQTRLGNPGAEDPLMTPYSLLLGSEESIQRLSWAAPMAPPTGQLLLMAGEERQSSAGEIHKAGGMWLFGRLHKLPRGLGGISKPEDAKLTHGNRSSLDVFHF